ncbi:Arginyl-tRNA synthetase [Borealophlyctis nickersoniae]|nr:Arginyl-tRNA synthetase [Borealophlyctis nickersoniae]
MANVYHTHIATVVGSLSQLPADLLKPLIERQKFKDKGQFAVALAKLAALGKKCRGAGSNSEAGTGVDLVDLSPLEFGKRLAQQWPPDDKYISSVTCTDTFLNFYVNPETFITAVVNDVSLPSFPSHHFPNDNIHRESSGCVIIEYAMPNMGQPFESNHLRGIAIANFVARACAMVGYEVETRCRMGLWRIETGLLLLGCESHFSAQALDEDPLSHLQTLLEEGTRFANSDPKAMSKAADLLRGLHNADPDITQKWHRLFNVWSKHLRRVFDRMNMSLDIRTDELECGQNSAIQPVLTALENVYHFVDARQPPDRTIDLSDQKLGLATLIDSHSKPTPITADVVSELERRKRGRLIKVALHGRSYSHAQCRRLVDDVARSMGITLHSSEDVSFRSLTGFADPPVTSLVTLLDRGKQHMMRLAAPEFEYTEDEHGGETIDTEQTADVLAVSAVVLQILQGKRGKDHVFDWERVVAEARDAGVYVQYAHVRLCGISRNYPLPITSISATPLTSLAPHPAALSLALTLSSFPSILEQACTTFEPSLLVTYLIRLAGAISSVNYVLRVKDQPEDVAAARMRLWEAARTVSRIAMECVGLKVLKRM